MSDELSVGVLSGRVELEDLLSEAVGKITGQIDQLENKFGSLGSRVAETAGGFLEAEAILETLKETAHLLVEELELMTIHGSVVQDVTTGYERLTDQVGLLGDELLGNLKTATHGTIDDFQLMKRVNEDLQTGTNLTQEQFTLLAQGAFALSRTSTIGVADAMDRLNDAMVTGRLRGVQLLTGKIDINAAEEKFAEASGHTIEQLTAEGKLEAAREELLDRVGQAIERVGDQQDSLKIQVEQGRATWANFEDEMDRVVSGSSVLNAGMVATKNALVAAFGPDQTALIEKIKTTVENLAIGMTYLALGGVEAARVIHTSFSVVETAVDAVATVIVGTVTGIGEVMLGLQKIGETLHIFPPGQAEEMKKNIEYLEDLTVDIAKNTAEAALGVVGQSEFDKTLDKLGGTIFTVRDAMVAAQQAEQEHSKTTAEFVGPVNQLAAGQERLGKAVDDASRFFKQSKADIKAYGDAWYELNSVGTTTEQTLANINPIVLAQVEYYLRLGASIHTVAAAFPELTKAEVQAAAQSIKVEDETAVLNEKVWEKLFTMRSDLYATDTQKLELKHDQDYAAAVAEAQRKGIVDVGYYNALWALRALDSQKDEADKLQADTHSKAYAEKFAASEKEKYDFAIAHADQYTNDWIIQLQKNADAAKLAADTFGTSFDGALSLVDAHIAKTIDGFHQLQMASAAASLGAVDAGEFDKFTHMTAGETAAVKAGQFVDLSQVEARWEALDPSVRAKIEGRRAGGPVTPGQPYIVGEDRPELFIPDSAGSIVSGIGGVTNIYVTGAFGTMKQVTDAVSAAQFANSGRKFTRG